MENKSKKLIVAYNVNKALKKLKQKLKQKEPEIKTENIYKLEEEFICSSPATQV